MKWLLLISAKKTKKKHAGTGAELINISIQGRKQDVETIRLTAAAGERGKKKNCVTTQEIQR